MKIESMILPGLACLGLCFAGYSIIANQPTRRFQEASLPPPQSSFSNTVAAPGLVEPRSESISIGSPRSGVVEEVLVSPGVAVQAGQPLVRLETHELERQLAIQQALLREASVRVRVSQGQAQTAQARLKVAEGELEQARRLLAFVANLGDRRLVRAEDLALRESSVAIRSAEVEAARAEVVAAEALTEESIAAVEVAEERVRALEHDIARSTLRAPMDAAVLQVRVRPGEAWDAEGNGEQKLLIGKVDELHVRVDVDEHEAWRVEKTAPAEAQVRGNPGQRAELSFVRFEPYIIPKRSLTGDATERVDTRVLQVIYRIENSTARLFAGQQVDVFIRSR